MSDVQVSFNSFSVATYRILQYRLRYWLLSFFQFFLSCYVGRALSLLRDIAFDLSILSQLLPGAGGAISIFGGCVAFQFFLSCYKP